MIKLNDTEKIRLIKETMTKYAKRSFCGVQVSVILQPDGSVYVNVYYAPPMDSNEEFCEISRTTTIVISKLRVMRSILSYELFVELDCVGRVQHECRGLILNSIRDVVGEWDD